MWKGFSEEMFDLSALENSVLSGYFYSNASWTSHQMSPGSKWPQVAFPVSRPYYTPLPMFMISENAILFTSHSAQIFGVTPPPSLITRSRCHQSSGATTPPRPTADHGHLYLSSAISIPVQQVTLLHLSAYSLMTEGDLDPLYPPI